MNIEISKKCNLKREKLETRILIFNLKNLAIKFDCKWHRSFGDIQSSGIYFYKIADRKLDLILKKCR